ncbi:murein L,D-transpeptidase catalytic domain family protein [Psychromonas sp. SP041]|uniref:murein L,D-transpeptidase catalytic domain family protein n=1 Tax=Psychromonas sp. SP041 TaxID=1365007 RepID=UPI0010C77E5F|nr:murein L,D-transpeptidase catalytic domain family protein [Psychromonas sp. SP041]
MMPVTSHAESNNSQYQYTGYKAWAYYTYAKANLNNIVNKEVFMRAFEEYSYLDKEKEVLTIIDYSKPSSSKRFYVIDVKNPKLLYNTYVSHGIGSGKLYATEFSNNINSLQTSLGSFITAETYYGANGYSLKIDGLDKGINDNARKRYIVVHGAPYSKHQAIEATGMLGRSEGCPALPSNLSKEIINTIKGGSIIYSYGIKFSS